MSNSVLFVCLGNICRSPAAEAVARARIDGVTFDSAGTSGWHVGEPPYGPMRAAAARRGYDLDGLRARRFLAEDFMRFGLILGMDAGNLAKAEALRPQGNATPLRRLADFAPELETDTIPDPYYTRDFDGTLDLIEAAITGLARAL